MNKPSVAIIVINYKNYDDTIGSIQSLIQYPVANATIFLVDNFSPNESAEIIQRWVESSFKGKSIILNQEEFKSFKAAADFKNMGIVFVKTNENMGFAKGNNFIISQIIEEFDFILLFNNDAFCQNNAVEIMIQYLDEHRNIGAATCRIDYFDRPGELQQMGGKLTWYGHFKRYSRKQLLQYGRKGSTHVPVTFATGCVLMLRSSLLKKFGLLSEKIFFGEEDVELALRYKRNNISMVSIIAAVVQHKGGASQRTIADNFKDAGYATSMIGRAVMLKGVYGKAHWFLWYHFFKFLMSLNILLRRRFGWRRTVKILKVINKYALVNNSVSADTYFEIIREF